jgi:hypothetical protein
VYTNSCMRYMHTCMNSMCVHVSQRWPPHASCRKLGNFPSGHFVHEISQLGVHDVTRSYPTLSLASSTVTLQPFLRSKSAHARPARPDPTTVTSADLSTQLPWDVSSAVFAMLVAIHATRINRELTVGIVLCLVWSTELFVF